MTAVDPALALWLAQGVAESNRHEFVMAGPNMTAVDGKILFARAVVALDAELETEAKRYRQLLAKYERERELATKYETELTALRARVGEVERNNPLVIEREDALALRNLLGAARRGLAWGSVIDRAEVVIERLLAERERKEHP